MTKAKLKDTEKTIQVQKINRKLAEFCVVSETPIVLNRMAEKAKHELLMPRIKNRATRSVNLKHIPREEFMASAHRLMDANEPTYLAMPSTAFKCAMADAALDVPGDARKAPIGRMTYVLGDYVGIYGIPKLYMAVVRMADFNKTPDIRTRVIIPKWAAKFVVSFVTPMVTETTVANLLLAAGMIRGVGDGRVEKGTLSFGQFRLCSASDKEFKQIVREGGRAAQLKAMEAAVPYDEETRELLAWFDSELEARNKPDGKPAAEPPQEEEAEVDEIAVQ